MDVGELGHSKSVAAKERREEENSVSLELWQEQG